LWLAGQKKKKKKEGLGLTLRVFLMGLMFGWGGGGRGEYALTEGKKRTNRQVRLQVARLRVGKNVSQEKIVPCWNS